MNTINYIISHDEDIMRAYNEASHALSALSCAYRNEKNALRRHSINKAYKKLYRAYEAIRDEYNATETMSVEVTFDDGHKEVFDSQHAYRCAIVCREGSCHGCLHCGGDDCLVGCDCEKAEKEDRCDRYEAPCK